MLPSTRKLVAAMAAVVRLLLLPAAFAWPASTFLTNLSLCASPMSLVAANLGGVEPSLGSEAANVVTMVSRGAIFIYRFTAVFVHFKTTTYS